MIGRPQQVCMMGLDIRNGICRSTPLLFIAAASCRVTEELRVLHTLSGKVLKTRKRISRLALQKPLVSFRNSMACAASVPVAGNCRRLFRLGGNTNSSSAWLHETSR